MNKLQNTDTIAWQAKIDLLSELTGATATAIMRRTANGGFKTYTANYSENYPRLADNAEALLESFCEIVFQHQEKFRISSNPAVIPFLMVPIQNPDKTTFGALCLAGLKAENPLSAYMSLLKQFRVQFESALLMDCRHNHRSICNGVHIEKHSIRAFPLEQSEEKYRRLFESSSDSIFILNEEGRFTQCNTMALNMLERSEKDIIGRTPAHISPKFQPNGEPSSDQVTKDITLAFQGNDLCFEWVLLKGDGSPIPVEVTLCGFTENNNRYIYALLKNFTEKENREKALRESEERFRTIYMQSADGIVLHEPNEGFTECNNAAFQLLGLSSKNDLIGKSILDFSPEIQPNGSRSSLRAQIHLRACMRDGQTRFEWVHLKKDGTPIWVDIVLTKIIYGNKELVHGLWRDISEVKHYQGELVKHQNHLQDLVDEKSAELYMAYEGSQKLNEKLRCANLGLQSTNKQLSEQKEKLEDLLAELQSTREQLIDSEKMAVLGTLTQGVAHEINNPLNFISGGSQLIKSTLKDQCEDALSYVDPFLNVINEGVEKIAEIVDFLGKYRRDYDCPKSLCDPHEVVENCLTILKAQFDEKSIKIRLDLHKEPISLLANEGEMHHAILNILVNAIEAVNGNGRIEIASERTSDLFQLMISDNGQGINEVDLKKIFDPFFTTKDPGKCTGIGLSMAKKIVMDHQGSIKCTSEVNKGSSFIIQFPVK